jgi:hypothetical protein
MERKRAGQKGQGAVIWPTPELGISTVNHPDCASRAEPNFCGRRIPIAENFPLLPVQSP